MVATMHGDSTVCFMMSNDVTLRAVSVIFTYGASCDSVVTLWVPFSKNALSLFGERVLENAGHTSCVELADLDAFVCARSHVYNHANYT